MIRLKVWLKQIFDKYSKKQAITLWKSVILLQLKKGSVCDFYLGHFICITIHLLEFIIGLEGSITFLRSSLQDEQ